MTHAEEAMATEGGKSGGAKTSQMNGHATSSNETRDPEVPPTPSCPPEASSGPTTGSSVVAMDGTDSGGSTAGGGASCGLVSSLFPSSCRGRAEAFARRLHHRLTSLGGDGNGKADCDDPAKPSETSWLHSGATSMTHNHVLERQPRYNSDSDLYFDFDIEDDGPGSPAEEVTDAELAGLLVNTEIMKTVHHEACHCSPSPRPVSTAAQDPESGCVFSSPVTGTSPESDSSDAYFDPETSEHDQANSDSFFDPATMSESDSSNLLNGRLMARVLSRRDSSPKPEKFKAAAVRSESSESSDSVPQGAKNRPAEGEGRITGQKSGARGSTDSLNGGRSSLDTTSPSHESLWSTFDDSTLSLRDESPLRSGNTLTAPEVPVRKSYSDSELPTKKAEIDAAELDVRSSSRAGVDEVDFIVNGVGEESEEEEEEVAVKEEKDDDEENDTEEDVKDEELTEECKENAKNLSKNIISAKVENDSSEVSSLANGIPKEQPKQEITDPVELKDPLLTQPPIQSNEMSDASDSDHSTYSSTINIPSALTRECPPGTKIPDEVAVPVKNELKLEIRDEGIVQNGTTEEKMVELLKRLGGDPTQDVEQPLESPFLKRSKSLEPTKKADEERKRKEEEEERVPRVRRCSSLKTGKTPPGTPGRKKIVQFADVLGLDLADVRTFLDEIPKIPTSAYSDLTYDESFLKDSPADQQSWYPRYTADPRLFPGPLRNKPDRTLVPLFQQPGGLPNFLDLVRERQVCLENVLVQDPIALCLQGTVRVRNLDFHKSVHIRYTLNGWRTFSDLQATYVPNSCDGFSDKFSFVLYCHTLNVGQRLEFAVRFQCKGVQYWDSNNGANYSFQCLPNVPSTGDNYMPIAAPETGARDWTPAFY